MIVLKRAESYAAFRISPGDTNKMVLLLDPAGEGANFVSVIEIFDVGGRTPPNKHAVGQEMFFTLRGRGRAVGENGAEFQFGPGDCMMVPPGGWHEIENVGEGRLYCLTVMVPNDGFAEMIRAGTPATLDAEDMAVIGGRAT